MVRKIKAKERKWKKDQDYVYNKKKKGARENLKEQEVKKEKEKRKGKEKIQDSIINVDDLDLKLLKERPENKKELAQKWRAWKTLQPDDYNKLY